MYLWLIFLHVAALFVFLLSHGASASVSFKLRRETSLERIRALLDLSASSYTFMYSSLLVILVSGIITGFMGRWWNSGWIWASIIVLIAVTVLMYLRGSNYYSRLRKIVGLPYFEKSKGQPPLPAEPIENILSMLKSSRPLEVLLIGMLGLLVLLWLMMFKPF